jgi:hypothetical protein
MSSSEGLARLKNWQSAEKALVVPSISWKGAMRIFEVRVIVASVDESTLVLVRLDPAGETKTFSLRDAAFGSTDEADLELTLIDGNKLHLREEE